MVNPTRRSVVHYRRGEDGAIAAPRVGAGRLELDPPGLIVDADAFFARI